MFDLSKFMVGTGSDEESQRSKVEILPTLRDKHDENTQLQEEEKEQVEEVEEEVEVDSPEWSDNDLDSLPGGDLGVPTSSANLLPQPTPNLPDKIPICPTESDSEPERENVPPRLSELLKDNMRSEDSYLPISDRLFSPGEKSAVLPPSPLSSLDL